jgi:hypothetical protein
MDIQPYSLEIEAPDLGADVKAVALELIESVNREPVRGLDAARIWAAVVEAIASDEPFVLDFFSHLDRVREFCRLHDVAFRDAAERCCVIPQLESEQLVELFQRFEAETFGIRGGGPAGAGAAVGARGPGGSSEAAGLAIDTELETDLSHRGVDAYHPAFPRYFFCAVTDFENGFLTVLSNRLSANEITRRARPAVANLQVFVALPQ